MQEYLTGDALYVNALMQRQSSNKLLVLVEGDDEDRMLFDHIHGAHAMLLVMGGKRQVMDAASRLAASRIAGVMCLVDRDLDDLTKKSGSYPNTLVATSGYDLVNDVVMADMSVFRRLLRVHGREETMKVSDSTGREIAEVVFDLALALAPLRLVNAELKLGLNLRDFPFLEILAPDYRPLPSRAVFEVALSRSRNVADWATIQPAISRAVERTRDRRLCGGHDLLSAAAAVLNLAGAKRASAAQLARSLQVAVNCELVKVLPIYRPLETWAESHRRTVFDCKLAA